MNVLLSDAQRSAVTTIQGPLLIVAGAGAGKTKTITERIVHIIKSGTAPHNILAITFTNKAAKEMRSRIISRLVEEGIVNSLYQSDLETPLIKTFHSFGVYILRRHAREAGLTKNFIIKDSSDANSLLKQAMKDEGIDPKEKDSGLFKNAISRYKSDFISVDGLLSGSQSHTTSMIARVWRRYESLLQSENSVDFDDLLTKVVVLFREHPEILRAYQNIFTYIHVDEYQDTNQVQYELCKLLAAAHNNICVVGDGDQNIYSWRGANVQNILQFENDYPNARVVILEENYRSTNNILRAANSVIKKNTIRKDKNLFTSKGDGEHIRLVQNYDEQSEAMFVARSCKSALDNGETLDEMAVLYRANFQSRVLEEAFLRVGVPYQVLGVKFFERREVKDVVSYVRAALSPESLTDIKRALEMPKRGIGKVTMLKVFSGEISSLPKSAQDKIKAFYDLLTETRMLLETKTLSETIEHIVQKSGIEKSLLTGSDDDRDRLENIRELVSLATKYDDMPGTQAAETFLEESTLISDQDNATPGGVKLMTVHASKGLEFDTVYIVGLENDLFPHMRIGSSKQTKEEQEEERRLFYVAITRAKKLLFLTYAQVRTIYGSRQLQIPSAFIDDIPEEHMEFQIGEGRVDNDIVYI